MGVITQGNRNNPANNGIREGAPFDVLILIFEPRGCFIYALNRIQLFLKRMTLDTGGG